MQAKLDEAAEKVLAAEEGRSAAEKKAKEVLALCEGLSVISDKFKRIFTEQPTIPWQVKLGEYMELVRIRGDKDSSRKTLRGQLNKWCRWIEERGSRPTDQLIKEHLIWRKVSRLTYFKIGYAIVDFSNYHLQQWDHVGLIAPVGHVRERDTQVMPREMVDALGEYALERCHELVPFKDKCIKDDDKRRFAKYLGKYTH